MRDILAGVHEAVVRRLVTLVQRLGIELVSPTIDRQVIGALGAALLAQKAAGAR